MKIIKLETIDSTNSYLKREYMNRLDFTWVTSEIQTHGKGRMNNSWIGSKESLMCSTLLKHDISMKNLSLYPLLAAVSLHKVLFKFHHQIMIKWPNDLYLKDKKLAGILCESIIEANDVHAIIIGFGINLNQRGFTDELKDIATSLYLHTDQIYQKVAILCDLKKQLDIDLKAYKENPLFIIDYCNKYNYLKGLEISFLDNHIINVGQVRDINSNGQLNVSTKSGLISLNSGHITVCKFNKKTT